MDSAPADSPDPLDPSPSADASDPDDPDSEAPDTGTTLPPDDVAAIDELGKVYQSLREELGKVIIGQDEVVEQLAICLFSRGHALLMGVPGLAKTLLISSVGECMHLSFSRIQFTPDLMPADITGTDIIQESSVTGKREFEYIKGPVFANLLLADEINRAPAKTQSALLEAMQENKVTALGHTYDLDKPFFVLATQNPIEQEGTYPLPEAQQDRFMFKIFVDYPTFDEEFEVARQTTTATTNEVETVLTAEEIVALQQIVREVPVSDHVIRYALSLVRQTRIGHPGIPEFVSDSIAWGAGPRAVQFLILGGKARALLHGRTHVSTEDIQALAKPVLRHRIVVNFAAESDGVTSDDVIQQLVEVTPSKEDELTNDARFQKIFAS